MSIQTIEISVPGSIPSSVEIEGGFGPQVVEINQGAPGATGPQGSPGPNVVNTNTQTTLTGLIKGDGSYVGTATAGTDYVTPTGDGSGLTGIKATQVFADDTERGQATPAFAGQLAYQSDTFKIYRATSVDPGDWDNYFIFDTLISSGNVVATGSVSGSNIDTSGNVTGNAGTATAALGLKTATTTVSVSSATAPTSGQALVATSSTTATWQTVSAGSVAVGSITGMGTGVATFLATPTSANLAAAVTDETGSGSLVFATSPTITTPTINRTSVGLVFTAQDNNSASCNLTTDSSGRSFFNVNGKTGATGQAGAYLTMTGYEEAWANVVCNSGTSGKRYMRFGNKTDRFSIQLLNDSGTLITSTPFSFANDAPTNAFYMNSSGGITIGATTDAGASNLLVSGGVTATTLTFNGASATSSASGRFDISSGATARLRADGNGVSVSGYLSVGQTIAANEARLYPDAANILAQRNSTSAQTSRVYTTFTARGAGTTNLEAVEIKGQAAGNFIFQSLKGSAGGTARDIEFRHGATDTNGTITNGTLALTITSARVTASLPIKLPGYTFAALPAGSVGDMAYITDGAASPTYRANAAGGGSAVTQVFFDGTKWINS